ncbi:type I secretion membrane fusion protein, HlyD family [compost metagenome]
MNSFNAPKTLLAPKNGKLIQLLVNDGDSVSENELLAFLETTAQPEEVLALSGILKQMQNLLNEGKTTALPDLLTGYRLGELQGAYQVFYQEYLQFQATQTDGYYSKRRAFLQAELSDIGRLRKQILSQREVQRKEYRNAEEEYRRYQTLYNKKVISRSEYVQQENKYLSAGYPLQQSETALLTNTGNYAAKEKELFELQHSVNEQQVKFVQALNQFLTDTDSWMVQHVLCAPVSGKLSYAGIVQEKQNISANQEVFIINPGNTDFFGEIQIPQYNMGKIHKGEKALVKLRSFPFEQYGMIRGTLSYVSDAAYRDSVFMAKVRFDQFEQKDPKRKIVLKNGMFADVEIITEESSLLQRFFRNLIKMMNGEV